MSIPWYLGCRRQGGCRIRTSVPLLPAGPLTLSAASTYSFITPPLLVEPHNSQPLNVAESGQAAITQPLCHILVVHLRGRGGVKVLNRAQGVLLNSSVPLLPSAPPAPRSMSPSLPQ